MKTIFLHGLGQTCSSWEKTTAFLSMIIHVKSVAKHKIAEAVVELPETKIGRASCRERV